MTIRNVGPNSTYPTIAAAVTASAAGDIIRLEDRYSNERAVLTVEGLTVMGGPTSRNIELVLGVGINDVTLDGLAHIRVLDNSGSNIITGNGGGNLVHVSGGADVVHGGDGHDRIEVVYREAMTTVVATAGSVTDGGTNSVTFDGFDDISIVSGSAPDNLTVGDGDNWLNSGGGNDTVVAGEGYNQIDTEGGDDHITADSGVIYAGPGNDTISIEGSNRFGGFVDAGSGNDTVTTGDGDNFAHGEEGDDTITTGGGDDYVTDGSGHDIVTTGSGDDSVRIFGGIDTVDGGTGHDLLYLDRWQRRTDVTVGISAGSAVEGYSGLAADATGRRSVSFTGFEQFDIRTGTGDDDVRIGAGNDTVQSGGGDDFVRTGAGNDELSSSNGADTLSGGGGDDSIFGGDGADTLIGGRGDDRLLGGYGADTLIGGHGADVFVFGAWDSTVGASDVIDDLQARDTIDLWFIDANTTSAGDQAFNLVATFSGTAGEATLRYQAGGNVTRLILDTDGDASADIVIIAAGDQRDFSNFVL